MLQRGQGGGGESRQTLVSARRARNGPIQRRPSDSDVGVREE